MSGFPAVLSREWLVMILAEQERLSRAESEKKWSALPRP